MTDPKRRETLAVKIASMRRADCNSYEIADFVLVQVLALIQKEQADTQREAFNAGYSYGIEAEASPEEYDVAWKLYQQSGRVPPQGEDG